GATARALRPGRQPEVYGLQDEVSKDGGMERVEMRQQNGNNDSHRQAMVSGALATSVFGPKCLTSNTGS
ncbi:MAG: hypothetical protein QM840_11175, partial [Verrucomicrobiota bacterium]|nr:hypothetical protein [Verrucomicrobiota bacterium]